jgi:hypothetical protein
MATPTPLRCPGAPEPRCSDPTCCGWEWFNDQDIERCDECGIFASDLEAVIHVQSCAPCRQYLEESAAGSLTIRAGEGWDWLVLCETGDPGCMHLHCDTCSDSHCLGRYDGARGPEVEIPPHKCTGQEHGS